MRHPDSIREFPSGLKRDTTEGKTNWSLVFDGPLLVRLAVLLTKGAETKGKRNWMKAGSNLETAREDLERFQEGACRHFAQWRNGDTDEDHAAATVFNINGYEYVKARMEGYAGQRARTSDRVENPSSH